MAAHTDSSTVTLWFSSGLSQDPLPYGRGSVERAFYEPNRTPTVREGILQKAAKVTNYPVAALVSRSRKNYLPATAERNSHRAATGGSGPRLYVAEMAMKCGSGPLPPVAARWRGSVVDAFKNEPFHPVRTLVPRPLDSLLAHSASCGVRTARECAPRLTPWANPSAKVTNHPAMAE